MMWRMIYTEFKSISHSQKNQQNRFESIQTKKN